MDRRSFVGLLGAGLLPRMAQAQGSGKVVVIGAGLAGLAAGLELFQAGVDVEVLEARGEPGGRVRTLRSAFADGLHAEAGAAAILGSHRLLQQYAARLGLRLVEVLPPPSSQQIYLVAGHRIVARGGRTEPWPGDLTSEERSLGLAGMWRRYVGDLLPEIGDPVRPGWPSDTVARYDGLSMGDFLRMRGASPAAVALLSVGYLSLGGDGVETCSALATLRDLAQRGSDARTWFVEGGNDRLPAALAERLGERVHHDTPVVRIEPGERAAAVLTRRGGVVRRWNANRVICTLPPAVLADVEVSPAFSPARRQALAGLRLTSVTRVLVQTRTRFWQAQGLPPSAVSDLPVQWVSDATLLQPGRRGILSAELGGPGARRLAALPVGERLSAVMGSLDRIYPGVRQEIETATLVDWDADPWARGAYAWFRPGQLTSLLPTLIAPEGRIHFAGEHTASASGWMEGALQSGLRVAAEVLAALRSGS
jgi:monoamine oxidase